MSLVNKYLCCCIGSDNESDTNDFSDSEPLLSAARPSPPPDMGRPVKNVYGKKSKKIVPPAYNGLFDAGEPSQQPLADITNSAANFTQESQSGNIADAVQGVIEHLQDLEIGTDQASRASSLVESLSTFDHPGSADHDVSSVNAVVNSVGSTAAVESLYGSGNSEPDESNDVTLSQSAVNSVERLAVSITEFSPTLDRTCSDDPNDFTADESAVGAIDPRVLQDLQPITEAYLKDRGFELYIQSWDNIISKGSQINKIAEASFAEVYRIENPAGSSILKVMNLKVQSDNRSALRERSILVDNVVSEIRIMNALTEVPGFVTFKEAHIVQGTPPEVFSDAYRRYLVAADGGGVNSEFPDPSQYEKDAVFLVIELGDAGTVLEDLEVMNGHQFIDVLFGVIIALARAEQLLKFEHRDLHENNVCFAQEDVKTTRDSTSLYGRSGLSITIIDYGLSRAELNNGEVIFNDLENDPTLFLGSGASSIERLQFNIYRLMRVFLLTGELSYKSKDWHRLIHSEESQEMGIRPGEIHVWNQYAPHSNALWVRYLFKWLAFSLKEHAGKNALGALIKEIGDLQDTLMALKQGSRKGKPFLNATEILQYLLDKGWIEEDQLLGDGEEESFLS